MTEHSWAGRLGRRVGGAVTAHRAGDPAVGNAWSRIRACPGRTTTRNCPFATACVRPQALRRVRRVLAAAALLPLLNPPEVHGQRADLTLELTRAGAQPAVPTGTNVAFDVTVANNVGQAVTADFLTRVTLPAEFVVASASGTGFQCEVAARVVSCTTRGVNAQGEKRFRISTTMPRLIRGTSQAFQLTAVVDPDNDVRERENANNSDNLTVNVETRADLEVTTAGSSTTVVVPNELVYVVTATNEGDRDASNVVVRATLPKDVDFERVEQNQLGTCLQNSVASNGALNVVCTLPSLEAGERRQGRIIGSLVGSSLEGVQVSFGVNVDPNNAVPERNDTNNTAFVVTTIRSSSDLQMTGSLTSGTFPSTQPAFSGALECLSRTAITLSLTVRNNGPALSAPVRVTTAWPAGIVQAPGALCFESCTLPVLQAGQSATVQPTGVLDVNLAGAPRATATVDADQRLLDPVRTNNSVTFTVCRPA